jgi:HEAT repeat protein
MSHHLTIPSRIAHLDARIRSTHCPRTIAVLVRTMTAHRDVEAIPVLIGLLDLADDHRGSVERALVRYGEAAEDSLKAHALANWPRRESAIRVLSRIADRTRLRRLGCF